MKRRLPSLLCLALAALVASVPAAEARARKSRPNWAISAIRVVVRHHILPETTVRTFMPNAPLDPGTLYLLVSGSVTGGTPPAVTGRTVTMGQLDAAFVRALGLGRVANRALVALRSAGYTPAANAGTEIVARLLQLRFNHPAAYDAIERSASEVATRAEAAWTTARVLNGVDTTIAETVVAKLEALPATTGPRHDAIDRAVHQLGMPYVWGGTSENAAGGPDGPQLHGGFDCSGLVWRALAYDPASLPGTAALIGGRTTYDMARTTPARRRLAAAAVRPGDILLFSSSGRHARWTDVGHTGIAIGNGLFIHSSSQGVAIQQWDAGWYRTSFAWGKSVLP